MARREKSQSQESEFTERLVHINRVAKVVKGGRRFGFAALVVVGDQRGRVGFGKGKAREVPEAIRKGTEAAKKNMIRVPLREGRTLHHDVHGRHGAGKVMLRTAEPGTGIIAGGPMRAVFEGLGVQDVVTKSIGTSNPYNMVRATFDALKKQMSPRQIAAKRGMKVADIVSRRGGRVSNENEEAKAAPAEVEAAAAPKPEKKADKKKDAVKEKEAPKAKDAPKAKEEAKAASKPIADAKAEPKAKAQKETKKEAKPADKKAVDKKPAAKKKAPAKAKAKIEPAAKKAE